MDGDDISLPTRLEKESKFLDNNPEYAIVSTPMLFFDEDGVFGKNNLIEKPSKRDFISRSPVHCHGSCMIRKEAYLAVNGYTEDERMLRFEDVNLWYKLYAKNYIGFNLSEPLYKMRDDRSAARRRSLKSRMKCIYVMYIGFKLFDFPWYMYVYLIKDFALHLIKGIIPERLYLYFHKRSMNESKK